MEILDDIPGDGLEEVLRGWSGRGQLYEALAAVRQEADKVQWHRRDIEGRARRIIFTSIASMLQRWPESASDWLHALPAQSLRERRMLDTPGAGTDWVETRVLGWPPEQFIVRDRSRVADQALSRTLRWTLDQVAILRQDAIRVESSLRDIANTQVSAALSLRNRPPLDATDGIRPTPADVRALKRSGVPWTRLAPVTEILRLASAEDLFTFARKHLIPDDDIRWRLFHLAVLGKLLKTFRKRGASIISLRPLSGAVSPGPCYRIELDGRQWDLWFEAEAIWDYYGRESPYRGLMRTSLNHPASPLGADILLIIPMKEAYSFECKFGNRGYVARNGYLQACTYALELRGNLAKHVESYVVGPDSKVVCTSEITLGESIIGVIGPRHFSSLKLFI